VSAGDADADEVLPLIIARRLGRIPECTAQRFADLDLSHSQGAAVLYRRLKGAAETVCGVEGSVLSRDLGSHKRSQECIRSALDAAVAKVNQPALTAYYRAQFEGRNATSQIAKNWFQCSP
jgi:UrcA family protein